MAAPGPKPRRFGPEIEVPSLCRAGTLALYTWTWGRRKETPPHSWVPLMCTTQAPSLEEKPVTRLGKV